MKDFQLRVVQEKQALEEKIEKLETFVLGDTGVLISDTEREYLIEQLDLMKRYASVLRQRIELF